MQIIKVGALKWFKLFGRFSFILLFASSFLNAQSFADFKQTQSSLFNSFKDERDTKFSQYLKEQWLEFESYKSMDIYKKQKPKQLPSASLAKTPNIGPLINIHLPKSIDVNQSAPQKQSVKHDINIVFFGSSIGFELDRAIQKARFYPQDQNGIIAYFSALANSEYENYIFHLQQIIKKQHLNDWGVYQLVQKLSQELYNNLDEQRLFVWFILNKIGYDVKVAIAQRHIVLLLSSQQTIYMTPRYKINEKFYYAIDYENQKSPGRIFTYEKKYPNADKEINFSMKTLPLLSYDMMEKTLKFKTLSQKYTLHVTLNKNLIEFMKSYPQVSYEVYFNAAMADRTYNDLAKQIRKQLNGKKASYGINFLLHFVQKGLTYQRDRDQFGKEKVMFAEEALYYDKSDCEDRAILFAQLVSKVLGYKVIGVKYADHMATALYVPMHGDTVSIAGRRYVIADPTYVNANVGKSMPKYKNIQPESFIRLQPSS